MFSSLKDPELTRCLTNGGVVVIPTDTAYGVVARAPDEQAVSRLRRIRSRSAAKPCIVLVADTWQITDNSLWNSQHKMLARDYWPGPLSLVAPTVHTPEYLHCGTHTLAYRVPDNADLRALLSVTGPLIAPSANPEGKPLATTIAEAQQYFGDTVDGYVDGGTMPGDAHVSTLVKIIDGKITILRQGTLRLKPQHTL